jgi:hypothetical protein
MKTVIRPSFIELLFLLMWAGVAALIAYAAYRGSWSLSYTGDINSRYVISKKWSPDMFTLGFLMVGAILLAAATELFARSVIIDGEFVSSRSPLGLYRQQLRRAEIRGFRISRVFGWGQVLEVMFAGKWIVFLANSRFKDCPSSYIEMEKTSNPLQTPASGTPAAGAPVAPPPGAEGQ